MTQDSTTVTPEVQAALNRLYQRGFDAGTLEGYAKGFNAARAEMLTLVGTIPSEMSIPKLPLDIGIEELDFNVKTYNCLQRESIRTIGQLLMQSADSLLKIRTFGVKNIDEVILKLGRLGYDLAPSPSEFK